MTIAGDSEVENTSDRFSTQIQYIDKSVLSRVETVKSQIVQKSPQV